MTLQVNGVHINYRIDGPDGAPWVTLSNSLATTHRMWDAQMDALTRQYRVLRYDKRGHGESEVAPGPYSFELLADDVLALLAPSSSATRPARIRSAIRRCGSSASTPSVPGGAWSPWWRARWRASSPRTR